MKIIQINKNKIDGNIPEIFRYIREAFSILHFLHFHHSTKSNDIFIKCTTKPNNTFANHLTFFTKIFKQSILFSFKIENVIL